MPAPDWTKNFCAFDTETTGVGPDARIVEVAVVHFKDYEAVDTYSQLIYPEGVDWNNSDVVAALSVNGLDYEDLRAEPIFEAVFADICCQLSAAPVWCAHNVQFDLQMLKNDRLRMLDPAAAAKLVPKPSLIVDTMLLDFILKPGYLKRRLSLACERWEVVPESSRRAHVDASASGQILCKMAPLLWDEQETAAKLWAARQEWDRICDRAAKRG
jgi:DNA polymerase III alpha subunit (gram-positive type)